MKQVVLLAAQKSAMAFARSRGLNHEEVLGAAYLHAHHANQCFDPARNVPRFKWLYRKAIWGLQLEAEPPKLKMKRPIPTETVAPQHFDVDTLLDKLSTQARTLAILAINPPPLLSEMMEESSHPFSRHLDGPAKWGTLRKCLRTFVNEEMEWTLFAIGHAFNEIGEALWDLP